MPFFKRKPKPQSSTMNAVGVPVDWTSATVRRAEENRARLRPRDHQAERILELAVSVAHSCCSTNADVCAAVPLRLFRRKGSVSGVDRRMFKAAPISRRRRAYLGLGPDGAGYKVAGAAESGGEVEEVLEHPIIDLIANPNPLMTGNHFDWSRFYSKQMLGDAYEEKVFGGEGIVLRMGLFSQFMIPIADSQDFLLGYRYGRSETEARDLKVDQVAHFKHKPSRFTPYKGEGSMAGVMGEAQLIIDNMLYDLAFVQEGHQPPGVLGVDPTSTPKQIESVKEEIDKQMRGIKGKLKTLVVRAPATYTAMAQTSRDLETLEKMRDVERKIRTAFGHTESMADSNASTKAAAIVGHSEQYLGGTIRPMVNSDADELNMIYLEDFGLDPEKYFLAYDNPVPRDAQMDEERYTKLSMNGLMTINEARAELDLPPFEGDDSEYADQLLFNGTPIGQAAAPADPFAGLFGSRPTQTEEPEQPEDTPDAEAEEAGDTPEDDGGDEKSAASEKRIDSQVGTKDMNRFVSFYLQALMRTKEAPQWDETRSCGCGFNTKDDDDDIAINKLIREMTRQHGEDIRETMLALLTGMQDETIQAIREGTTPDLSSAVDQAKGELINSMQPMVEAGVRNVLEELGADDDAFSVVPQRALAFLDQHAAVVADDIAGTTVEMVNTAVRSGLEHGLSIDDIASEIEGVPEYRAERIARTEVQFAVQGGKYAGFQELGVKQTVWRTAPGASAAHRLIAERSPKEMGEPYVKAGEELAGEKFTRDVYMPPARPNCRCNLEAVLEDDE